MRCSGFLSLAVACSLAFEPLPEPAEMPRVEAEDRWDSLIQYHAHQAGLDWRMVKAIMLVESSGDPRATSPKGARGLMQLMPVTLWQWLDTTVGVGGPPPLGLGEAYDPDTNMRVATRHLSWLLESLSRHVYPQKVEEAALAAYFAGYGRIRRHLARHGTLRVSHLPPKTRAYVQRVDMTLTMLRQAEHGGE